MSVCVLENCGKPLRARGYCVTHYEQWRRRRFGSDFTPQLELKYSKRLSKPIWLRLVLNVKRDDNGCWIWQGQLKKGGYAQMPIRRRRYYVHRVSYEAFVGPVPSGLEVDHLCRITSCINPDHLEPVTRAENQRRRAAAITHCKHGHPFSVDNTGLASKGHRVCRTCRSERARAFRRRQAQEANRHAA